MLAASAWSPATVHSYYHVRYAREHPSDRAAGRPRPAFLALWDSSVPWSCWLLTSKHWVGGVSEYATSTTIVSRSPRPELPTSDSNLISALYLEKKVACAAAQGVVAMSHPPDSSYSDAHHYPPSTADWVTSPLDSVDELPHNPLEPVDISVPGVRLGAVLVILGGVLAISGSVIQLANM